MQYSFRQPYFYSIKLLHTKVPEVEQFAKCHSKQTSSHATANRQGDRGIASIVILKNLNLADEHVQIQVLEVRAMWLFSFFLQAGSDIVRL